MTSFQASYGKEVIYTSNESFLNSDYDGSLEISNKIKNLWFLTEKLKNFRYFVITGFGLNLPKQFFHSSRLLLVVYPY